MLGCASKLDESTNEEVTVQINISLHMWCSIVSKW